MSRTSGGGRKMSGITSSGGGDVTLAGDNDFTGENTFNTNRPTSTLTSTPADDDFITKEDADKFYTGAVHQFVFKSDGAPYGAQIITTGVPGPGPVGETGGGPGTETGDPDQYDGLIAQSTLKPSITLKSSNSRIIIDCVLTGEWSDTGGTANPTPFRNCIMVRNNEYIGTGTGSTQTNLKNHTMLYGAQSFEDRNPAMSAVIFNSGGNNQFLDGYCFRYVDEFLMNTATQTGNNNTPPTKGDTISYQIVLTNGIGQVGNFFLNSTKNTQNARSIGRGCSTITLTEVEL